MTGFALIVAILLGGFGVWAIVKSSGRSLNRPIDRVSALPTTEYNMVTASFCDSCGAALIPGGAFCDSCGAPVAAPTSPSVLAPAAAIATQPPEPPPAVSPASLPPPAPATSTTVQPSAAAAQLSTSLDLQPGETELGSWTVNVDRGRLLTGKLRVTNLRLLFRPQVGGVGLIGILQTQRSSYKDAHTIILSRDQIVDVRAEKGFLTKNLHVTTSNRVTYVFGCGPRSIDEIALALQQH